MIIYKILQQDEFFELENKGQSHGSNLDYKDGFIHFSTRDQLSTTLKNHFFNQKNLILMAVESDTINERLKWEKSRGNELFPHLYSNLFFNDALWFAPIELVKDEHVIPSGA